MSWQDGALAVTKSNGVSVSLADSSQDNRVTINKELSLLAIWKGDDFFAGPVQLKHGAVLVFLRARDGSTSKEISSAQVTTSHSVMSDCLRDTIVKILHVAGGHEVVVVHGWGLDVGFKVDVI